MPSSMRIARDRAMRRRGPLAAAMRFATGVPGQILVNTAAFTLPEELRIDPNWRLLDIGCGRAGLLRVLAHRAGLLQPPVGLDASLSMLQLARQDTKGDAPSQVRLACGTAGGLPFAEATFNLALSSHAFKHLTDDELRVALVEARRVLKPGGLFLAWEFAPTRSAPLDRWNRWVLTRGVPAVRLRSYGELRALAYDCGFDWVQPANLRPFLLPPIPRVSLIMGRAPDGWRSTVVDGQRVLEHETGEPILDQESGEA